VGVTVERAVRVHPLAPFRSRSYLLVWIGALVSNIGTWMETVALTYYVADTTGKNTSSALVIAATFIPNGLLGPIGSALADRFNRRRTIIIGNLVVAAIAAVVAWWVGTGDATVAGLAILGFASGACFAFFFPSYQTVLPELVPPEHLTAAIGLSNVQWNLGRVLGPVAAAVAIWIGGIEAALWCNAASFLAVIVAVSAAKISTRRGERRPIFAALVDGVRFARRSAPMRAMLTVMVPTILLGSPFIAFVAQMATNVHGGDDRATSLLTAAQGVGAVVSGLTLSLLSQRFGSPRLMVWSAFAFGAVIVGYGAAPSLWLAAVGLLAIGVTYGWAFLAFSATAQQSAAPEMRGRALAVNSFVLGVGYPLSALLQGRIADSVGLRAVTIVSGAALCLVMVVLGMRRSADGESTQR
jgi:MFS family permease